jgi:hypothetical protein
MIYSKADLSNNANANRSYSKSNSIDNMRYRCNCYNMEFSFYPVEQLEPEAEPENLHKLI